MPGSDIDNRIPRRDGEDARAEETTLINMPQDADRTVAAPAHAPRPVGAAPAATANGNHAHTGSAPAKRKRGRAALIVLGVIVAVAGLVYAGGVAAFTFLFYPNQELAGIDVSLMQADAAAKKLDGQVDGYTLTLEDPDLGFSWTYEPEGGRNIFNTAAAAREKLAQNEPWIWPVKLYEAVTEKTVTSDEEALDLNAEPDLSLLGAAFNRTDFENSLGTAVDGFNANRSGVFNAQSTWDTDAGAFRYEKAASARKLNRDNIVKLALASLADLKADASLTELGEDLYLPLEGNPTEEQMKADCDAANAFLGTNVTFKLGDSTAGTLDGTVIGPWITFDTNTDPTLNTDAVAAWASELAGQMNTVGTERTYTRPDGKTITIGGGTFGWSVDEAALVQAVQDAVANHQTGDIQVPTSTQGDVFNGAGQPDWKKYVDVDISEQYARLYDENGNLIWETGVVTGKDNGEDDTPTGVYMVNNKARNINLVSQDKDPVTGEPEYISPVDYWIAWKGSSWGFHDASWQPAWVFSDPSAYHTMGSHGCINTPYDKVQQLFDLLEVGDCVIVHY